MRRARLGQPLERRRQHRRTGRAALAQRGQLAAGQPALAVGHERAQLAGTLFGRHGLPARVGGVAHGGLGLVVGRAHARLGIGDQRLDAPERRGAGNADAVARAARTADLVARAARTAARLAGLRLGAVRAALGHDQRALELGYAGGL